MRLLHTRCFQFSDFRGPRVESVAHHDFTDLNENTTYMILSHTWGDEELSFHDLMLLKMQPQTFIDQLFVSAVQRGGRDKIKDLLLSEDIHLTSLEGLMKALQFCRQVAAFGCAWVWIDSCCINKESSAELSEAINSMYKWYRSAAMCWAYLSDVGDDHDNPVTSLRELVYIDVHGMKVAVEVSTTGKAYGEPPSPLSESDGNISQTGEVDPPSPLSPRSDNGEYMMGPKSFNTATNLPTQNQAEDRRVAKRSTEDERDAAGTRLERKAEKASEPKDTRTSDAAPDQETPNGQTSDEGEPKEETPSESSSQHQPLVTAQAFSPFAAQAKSGPLKLMESRWFTRGWTLQELIAPTSVYFVDRNWHCLGDRQSLATQIAQTTGIPEDLLSSRQPSSLLGRYSAATKLSWAADRKTTRIEDRAYSLFGLFGVNMGLIYGEGENAFLRLQKKIIKTSRDETIFAWDASLVDVSKTYQGLLAPNPDVFKTTASYRVRNWAKDPISITNQGIGFVAFNERYIEQKRSLYMILPLDCTNERGSTLGVPLARLGGIWYRVLASDCTRGLHVLEKGKVDISLPEEMLAAKDTVYVSISPHPTLGMYVNSHRSFSILALRFRTHALATSLLADSIEPRMRSMFSSFTLSQIKLSESQILGSDTPTPQHDPPASPSSSDALQLSFRSEGQSQKEWKTRLLAAQRSLSKRRPRNDVENRTVD